LKAVTWPEPASLHWCLPEDPRVRGLTTWASRATLLVVAHSGPEAGEVRSEAAEVTPVKKDDWKWWKDNSTVIIAVLSVAVVAIRLLGVARGDPEIAYAILQIAGTGTVLIATLVSTLGLLAIPAFAIFAFYARQSFAKQKKFSATQFQLLLASSFAMLVIALYMSPVFLLAYSLAWWIPLIILSLTIPTTGARYLVIFVSAYVVGIFLYGLFSPTPWLPVQAISVAGQKPFTGYVLSQANGTTSILTSDPEGVIILPSQSVLAIGQCTPPGYQLEQGTLSDWFEHIDHKLMTYTACPSAPYTVKSPPT